MLSIHVYYPNSTELDCWNIHEVLTSGSSCHCLIFVNWNADFLTTRIGFTPKNNFYTGLLPLYPNSLSFPLSLMCFELQERLKHLRTTIKKQFEKKVATRTGAKHCLFDMTVCLYSWTHSSCGCFYKTCTKPRQPTVYNEWGRSSQAFTTSWGNMGSWWLSGEGDSVLLKAMALGWSNML